MKKLKAKYKKKTTKEIEAFISQSLINLRPTIIFLLTKLIF